MITPIFIFSLPRSGSTLLQRIIASHSEVATKEEPWLLLPLFGVYGSLGTYAEYNYAIASQAITKFSNNLPNGIQSYYASTKDFACSLYEKCAKGEKYFLDKTPRYHVISKEIIRTFDNGKFIFLIRHPLAVYASVIKTWKNSHVFDYDLYLGFDKIFQTLKSSGAAVHLVKYEELISSPEDVVQLICEYLEIDFQIDMLKNFSQIKFSEDAMGNPNPEQTKRKEIYINSRDKWKTFLCENIIRKRLAISYLKYIGADRMKTLEYDYLDAKSNLEEGKVGFQNVHIDILNIVRRFISVGLESPMLKHRLLALLKRQRYYVHR